MKYYQVPDEYPSNDTIGAYAPILLSAVDELLIEGTQFEGDEPRRKLETLKNWIASELGKGAVSMGYEELFNWGGYDLAMTQNVYVSMTPSTSFELAAGQKLVIEQVVEIMQTTGAYMTVAAKIDDYVVNMVTMGCDDGDVLRTKMQVTERAGKLFSTLEVWAGNGAERIDQADYYRMQVREYPKQGSSVLAYWRANADNADVVSRRRYSVVERYG